MKKILTALLSVLMVATVGIVNVNAEPEEVKAEHWQSYGATVTYSGNKAKIGTEKGGAMSWDAKGKTIDETGITVSTKVNVDLENDGELFTISVGVGSDASTYSDELYVMTYKSGDKYSATVLGKTFEIEEGENTYSWTFKKEGANTLVQFAINEEKTDFKTMTTGGSVVRYVWVFGRDSDGQSGYTLDEPLEIVLEDDVCEDPTEVEVKKWDSFGATVTPTNQGNTIEIGTGAGGAVSNDAKGKEINEKGITVSTKVNVNLENDGELFTISAGVGSDASTYTSELCVMTLKSGGKYSATVFGKTFEIEEGVNTYSWTFVKYGDQPLVSFAINDESTDFNIMYDGNGNNVVANVVRYVWAFGRDTTGGYKLDEPLEIYLRATPSYENLTFDGEKPNASNEVSVTYTGNAVRVAGFDEKTLSVDSSYRYKILKINNVAQTVSENWERKTIKNNSTDTLKEIVDAGEYEIIFQVVGVWDDESNDWGEVGLGKKETYTIIVEPSDAEKSFTVDDIPVQTYTGSEIKPKVVVKHGTKTLVEGVDYTVTYENNINVTTKDEPAIASITGKGNYTGTIYKDFNIVAPVIYYVPPVTGVE